MNVLICIVCFFSLQIHFCSPILGELAEVFQLAIEGSPEKLRLNVRWVWPAGYDSRQDEEVINEKTWFEIFWTLRNCLFHSILARLLFWKLQWDSQQKRYESVWLSTENVWISVTLNRKRMNQWDSQQKTYESVWFSTENVWISVTLNRERMNQCDSQQKTYESQCLNWM